MASAKQIFESAASPRSAREIFAAASAEPPGRLEALGRGAAEGGTLNFADELAGAVRTFGDQSDQLQAGPGPEEIVRAYREGRDQYRGEDQAARAAHPGFYTGGQLGGGLATLAVPGLGVA